MENVYLRLYSFVNVYKRLNFFKRIFFYLVNNDLAKMLAI